MFFKGGIVSSTWVAAETTAFAEPSSANKFVDSGEPERLNGE
jgi:hypothetical protein